MNSCGPSGGCLKLWEEVCLLNILAVCYLDRKHISLLRPVELAAPVLSYLVDDVLAKARTPPKCARQN